MAKSRKKVVPSALKRAYDGRFDDVSAAILVCASPDGRIVSLNTEAEELTGYERAELESMVLSDIFRDEDRPRIDSLFADSAKLDFRKLIEHNVIVKKRSKRKIIVDMGFRRTEAGDALIFTLQDITDLKLNEERVIRAHEHVANIVDSIIELLVVVDEKDEIETVNAAALAALGFREDELVGRPVAQLLPELPAAREPFAEMETLVRARDGRVFPALASRSSLRGGEKAVIVAMDISERKRAERLISEQRMMIVQASKMSSLGEMASSIAHEINNPLMVILGRCEIVEMLGSTRGDVPADIGTAVTQISRMSQRIVKIVRGLQILARDGRHDAKEVADLGEIVRDTLALCEQRIRMAVGSFRVQPGGDGLGVSCRPTQISQVLLNLLNNSCDEVAGKPNAWIELAAGIDGDAVVITVTDSGKGIPLAVAEKLFTPFFTTKPVGKGTGIGLSVSRSLIESHGGTLTLDGACPNTRFVIRLPDAAVAAGTTEKTDESDDAA